MSVSGLPQLNIPGLSGSSLGSLGTSGAMDPSSILSSLGLSSPVFPSGMSTGGSGSSASSAINPLTQTGLSAMSPDTQALVVSIQSMMVSVMAAVASALQAAASSMASGGGANGNSATLASSQSVGDGSSPDGSGDGGSTAGSPNSDGSLNVNGMLSQAQSMVGETETGNTADIEKITKINPAQTPWCAAFAMNLLKNYGFNESGLSNPNYVPTVESWAKGNGDWKGSGSGYTPKPGDAICFGGGAHIGIVKSVDSDGTIHTIEGNNNNAVSEGTYKPGDSYIDGFIST